MAKLLPSWADPEWSGFVARWVPERGQADTVQGELLRDAIRITGAMGNNGLGNWLESPETYEAFADTVERHLLDGTFDPGTTEFLRGVIAGVRAYGRREITREQAPSVSDVDKLDGYAILWCLKHPKPIPRAFDERMEF